MGVKKSTVCTSARSGVRRYTPASSAVSKPIRTLASVCFGSLASTESKILGLNLAAQPAAFTIEVSLVRSSIILFACASWVRFRCHYMRLGGRAPIAPQVYERPGARLILYPAIEPPKRLIFVRNMPDRLAGRYAEKTPQAT